MQRHETHCFGKRQAKFRHRDGFVSSVYRCTSIVMHIHIHIHEQVPAPLTGTGTCSGQLGQNWYQLRPGGAETGISYGPSGP
jgi:hypothetical protein